jgi:hypothetical protein
MVNGMRIEISVVSVCFLLLAAVAWAGAEEPQGRILTLARDGKNIEAIALFEKLPKGGEIQTDVLRAAAGCYWRERRFEEARGLYRQILERQPNLRPAGSGKDIGKALLDRDSSGSGVVVASGGVAVPAGETAVAVPDAVQKELAALKAAYRELEAGKDQSRKDADARIATLSAETEARVKEIGALRAQIEANAGKATGAAGGQDAERAKLEVEVAALREQIKARVQDVDKAQKTYDALRTQSERKANDLLDAVAQEKKRRESAEAELAKATATRESLEAATAKEHVELDIQVKQAGEQVELERKRAAADVKAAGERAVADAKAAVERAAADAKAAGERAAADAKAAGEREAALLARIEEMNTASAAAAARVVSLEKDLQEMRDRVDKESSLLAVRNLELTQKLEGIQQGSVELALAEIERLELEHAALAKEASNRQAALEAQIAALEVTGAEASKVLAATEKARAEEQEKRLALEARSAQQAEELQRTKTMLDDATAALSRQYNAIRDQVQGGVTIRLEDADGTVTGHLETAESSDLAPLIGKLEAATASATAEVQQLRRQLEQERAAFAAASSEAEAGRLALKAEIEALTQRMDEAAVAASSRESGMVAAQARALEEMAAAHDLRVTGLKGEIDGIRAALAARDRELLMMESDLESERESSARVLALARANEETLSQRIRDLEDLLALSGTIVAGDGVDPSLSASVREILEMLPKDPSAAVSRFEALPPDAPMPVELLKGMGNLYREQHRYDEALVLFEKMLERDPDDLYADRKVVMTLFDMGRYDQALDRLAGPGQPTDKARK